MSILIQIDDLRRHKVIDLLQTHLDFAFEVSPPEIAHSHALDLTALRRPEITFWTAWEHNELMGCAALKELSQDHGEVKSMHTVKEVRGKGVASKLLENLISVAQDRSYSRLSLETGAIDAFNTARELYSRFGFEPCQPFANYSEHPFSVFMTKNLNG